MRAKTVLGIAVLTWAILLPASVSAFAEEPDGGRVIRIAEDRPDLNFVGQFINTGANSLQFGYISHIEGVENVFNSDTTQNESTAMFTFVSRVVTIQAFGNGPIVVRIRKGTTTIYYRPEGGASFANPASFEAGTPIQISDYRQQAVTETTSAIFNTTHFNTITSTTPFVLSGELLRLGRPHDAFRTHYLGKSNTPGLMPSGWFAGYAVGVSRGQD